MVLTTTYCTTQASRTYITSLLSGILIGYNIRTSVTLTATLGYQLFSLISPYSPIHLYYLDAFAITASGGLLHKVSASPNIYWVDLIYSRVSQTSLLHTYSAPGSYNVTMSVENNVLLALVPFAIDLARTIVTYLNLSQCLISATGATPVVQLSIGNYSVLPLVSSLNFTGISDASDAVYSWSFLSVSLNAWFTMQVTGQNMSLATNMSFDFAGLLEVILICENAGITLPSIKTYYVELPVVGPTLSLASNMTTNMLMQNTSIYLTAGLLSGGNFLCNYQIPALNLTNSILPSSFTSLANYSGFSTGFSVMFEEMGNYSIVFACQNLFSSVQNELILTIDRLYVCFTAVEFLTCSSASLTVCDVNSNYSQVWVNRTVYFSATYLGGPSVAYNLTIIQILTGNTIFSQSTSGSLITTIPFIFTQNGTYAVQLTLQNKICNYTSSTFIAVVIPELSVSWTDSMTLPIIRKPSSAISLNFQISGLINPTLCLCFKAIGTTNVETLGVLGNVLTCAANQNCSSSFNSALALIQQLTFAVNISQSDNYDLMVMLVNQTGVISFVSIPTLITDKDCVPPSIALPQFGQYSLIAPLTWYPSKLLFIAGTVNSFNCNVTLSNAKQWSLEQVDSITGSVTSLVDLAANPTSTSSSLSLPEYTLAYGSYKITFSVTMNQSVTVQLFKTSISFFIKVVPEALVLKLMPGAISSIAVGTRDTVVLSPALYSYNPNAAINTVNRAISNFIWLCWNVNETEPSINTTNVQNPYTEAQLNASLLVPDQGGCFRRGPGRINSTSGQLQFFSGNLRAGNSYVIKIVATEFNTAFSTQLIIQSIGVPAVPVVSVECLQDDLCESTGLAQQVSRSNPLKLRASCLSGCSASSPLTYTYKFYKTLTPVPLLPFYTVNLPASDIYPYLIGVNSSFISIEAEYFSDNLLLSSIVACCEITTLDSNGNTAQGSSCTTFQFTPLPKLGACNVSSSIATAFVDTICINCSETSPDIVDYLFYAQASGQSIKSLLGTSTSAEFCSTLPSGDQSNNYTVDVCVQAVSSDFSFTENCVSLQVLPASSSTLGDIDLTTLTVTVNSFTELLAKGSVQQVNSACQQYQTALNTLQYSVPESNATVTLLTNSFTNASDTTSGFATSVNVESLSSEQRQEYESNRDSRAQVAAFMSTALAALTTTSIDSILLTSSSISALTASLDQLNAETQVTLATKCLSMALNLQNLATSVPVGFVQQATFALLSSAGQLLSSANLAIANGVLSDVNSLCSSTDYDTDLDSSQPSVVDVDAADAGAAFCQSIHQVSQKSVASSVLTVASSTVGLLTDILQSVLVPGEQISLLTPTLSYKIVFARTAELSNAISLLFQNMSITLPGCRDAFASSCYTDDQAVLIEAYAASVNQYSFASVEHNAQVSADQSTISLTLRGTNLSEIVVSNLLSPVDMFIPRSKSAAISQIFVDAHLPEPYVDPLSGSVFQEQLIVHSFTISDFVQSYFFEFHQFADCQQLLVVFRFGTIPELDTGSYDAFAVVGSTSNNCSSGLSNRIVLNNTLLSASASASAVWANLKSQSETTASFSETLYVGVRQLATQEYGLYSNSNPPPKPYTIKQQFTTNYSMSFYSAACYFLNTSSSAWESTGCEVVSDTTSETTHCQCYHLTTFAAGWTAVPNKIEWNYVFSNLDLTKNPTLYVVEISFFLIFIVCFVWARRADSETRESPEISVMADNDPRDSYWYEIVVKTGDSRNSSARAKVSFILYGDEDETGVRRLYDDSKAVFGAGQTDRFLMTSKSVLGSLQFLRIWLEDVDNNSDASWFASFLIVRDVGNWFAADKGDGHADRIVPAASAEQIQRFGRLFKENAGHSLHDDHLWFSIFAYPRNSKFTRIQRLCVCFMLLSLNMLASAMFYGQQGAYRPNSDGLHVGPFFITMEQLQVSIVSEIIVFVPTFFVMWLFRHARPKVPLEDHWEVRYKSAYIEQMCKSRNPQITQLDCRDPRKIAEQFLSNIEATRRDRDRDRSPSPSASLSSELQEAAAVEETAQAPPSKTRITLPSCCVWLAWAIVIGSIIASVVFITFYGVMLGDLQCKKWLASVVISVLADLLLAQPLKLLLSAVFFSLICKESQLDNMIDYQMSDRVKDKVEAEYARMRLAGSIHAKMPLIDIQPEKPPFDPPSRAAIENLEAQAERQQALMRVIIDFLLLFFFWFVVVLLLGLVRDDGMYRYARVLRGTFGYDSLSRVIPFGSCCSTAARPDAFAYVRTKEDYWHWLQSNVDMFRAQVWYNGDKPLYLRGFLADSVSRLVGPIVLRQVRVREDDCVTTVLGIEQHGCVEMVKSAETRCFEPGWRSVSQNTSAEYCFTDSADLDHHPPFVGLMGLYAGGGYVKKLVGSASDMKSELKTLADQGWIDEKTKAVFLEMSVYNPNVGLFASVVLAIETETRFFYYPHVSVQTMRLDNFIGRPSVYSCIVYACAILCFCLQVYQIVREARRSRCAYFCCIWNYLDLVMIASWISCFATFVALQIEASSKANTIAANPNTAYVSLLGVAYTYWTSLTFFGVLLFLLTLKSLHILRFSNRISLLGRVLSHSLFSSTNFSVVFSLFSCAIVLLFYHLFVGHLAAYRNTSHSFLSIFLILLNKFCFADLHSLVFSPLVAAVFLVSAFFMKFVLACMFVCIRLRNTCRWKTRRISCWLPLRDSYTA